MRLTLLPAPLTTSTTLKHLYQVFEVRLLHTTITLVQWNVLLSPLSSVIKEKHSRGTHAHRIRIRNLLLEVQNLHLSGARENLANDIL
jgi:hypothetical protein